MDSQRFDPSRRRKSLSPTIATIATLGHGVQPFKDEDWPFHSITFAPPLAERWKDHAVPAALSKSMSFSDDSTTTTSGSSSNTLDNPSSFTSYDSKDASQLYSLSCSSNFSGKPKKGFHSTTDIFEKEGGDQTTRTIIRPVARARHVASMPTHPKSLFRRFDRTRNADAFEDAVDSVQAQRERELSGSSPRLVLRVEREIRVVAEEKWRSAIQAMLYKTTLPTNSVVGRVEVW